MSSLRLGDSSHLWSGGPTIPFLSQPTTAAPERTLARGAPSGRIRKRDTGSAKAFDTMRPVVYDTGVSRRGHSTAPIPRARESVDHGHVRLTNDCLLSLCVMGLMGVSACGDDSSMAGGDGGEIATGAGGGAGVVVGSGGFDA